MSRSIRVFLLLATTLFLVGCGSSAGSRAPSAPAAAPTDTPAATATEAAASEPDDATPTDAGSPDGTEMIGTDQGDRSKGSIQAQLSGGLTTSLDIPYAASLSRLLVDGPNTGYLPFTDTEHGTMFLTIADSGLLVQYAGPDQTGITNGATPCDLHLDSLDASGAKGSFTCKGMLLVKGDGTIGSVDMTASFEGHQ
jgi:hypothetical protein